MKIPIELLAILILFFIFLAWLIWKKISDMIILKRYNPDNDKSRKGEEQRRANQIAAGTVKPVAEPVDNIPKPSGLAERSDISVAETEPVNEDSSGIGTGNTRKFFSRFKRK